MDCAGAFHGAGSIFHSRHVTRCPALKMISIFTCVWKNPDRPVILASQSPRRRDILSGMGVTFEVIAPLVESEDTFLSRPPIEDALAALALAKANSISATRPQSLVLGADTIVSIDGRILSKPVSRADAAHMIERLSGRTHSVLTGVSLVCGETGFAASAAETTRVRFRVLEKWEIDAYLDRNEYRDKAGSYGIQGAAMTFVERIEGCYYNIVGLPVAKTIDLFCGYANRKDVLNV